MQVDVSENFTLHNQGEIQSAYWDQEQLTLFTISVSSKGMQTSITFVSDDLDHDEIAVLVFMNHLFILVKERFNVDVIDVFSDGAPSQFKNQYILKALTYFHSKCII